MLPLGELICPVIVSFISTGYSYCILKGRPIMCMCVQTNNQIVIILNSWKCW